MCQTLCYWTTLEANADGEIYMFEFFIVALSIVLAWKSLFLTLETAGV